MHATYPKPDRSNFRPRLVKDDDGVLDIGWAEGALSDGRPYRLECWAQDQLTCVTFFLSSLDLDLAGRERVSALLEQEGLLTFQDSRRYALARPMQDASGNALWSVNVVVGDDDGLFVREGSRAPALIRYAQRGTSPRA